MRSNTIMEGPDRLGDRDAPDPAPLLLLNIRVVRNHSFGEPESARTPSASFANRMSRGRMWTERPS